MFLHRIEHGSCRLLWVKVHHPAAVDTGAPTVCSSAVENSPQQLNYLLWFAEIDNGQQFKDITNQKLFVKQMKLYICDCMSSVGMAGLQAQSHRQGRKVLNDWIIHGPHGSFFLEQKQRILPAWGPPCLRRPHPTPPQIPTDILFFGGGKGLADLQ